MTVTWFFVGLLAGGMCGMLLMGLLASAAHADDVAELKAKVDFCERDHQYGWILHDSSSGAWSSPPSSFTTDSES